MKRVLIAAALLSCFSAQAGDARPNVEALFAQMGLTVQAREQRHFVVGDRVDGYFDGRTASYGQGAGYLIGQQMLFKDHASFVDDQLLDRRSKQARETVQPYGRELQIGASHERIILHAGSRRLSIQVSHARAARLAIQPMWADGVAEFRREGEQVLVTLPGSTLVAAISADQAFEISGADKQKLQARGKTKRFTVHIAFATDAATALAQARAMAGSDAVIAQSRADLHERLTRSWLATSDSSYNRALLWSKASALSFLVDEYGRGLWAGLPWFRENWGRDTFIALPGTLLVTGHFKEAREVLDNFARYQNLQAPKDSASSDPVHGPRASDYGRIPNRVRGEEKIYNTVDGTPWMLREGLEYVRYSGDTAFAERMLKLAGPYIEGALKHSVDADGLLHHDDADTWMDARIEGRQPWSARGPRAVEIQALWFTALESAAELARQAGQVEQATTWKRHAERARQSFLRLFWDGKHMADRLRADGSRDMKVRPNQLMLISVPVDPFKPLVSPEIEAKVLKNTVSTLLFPYGIASLDPASQYFHPHHVNDAYHHKDAAYHNGTIWGWNAGFTVTALNKYGQQDLAWRLSQHLGEQILGRNLNGTLGTMSELLDALPGPDGRPVPSGTFAQSWSVAEFARNAYQDYLGFRPDLLRGELHFTPALPAAWKQFDARLPFGDAASLQVKARRQDAKRWLWTITLQGSNQPQRVIFETLDVKLARQRSDFKLQPGQPVQLSISGDQLKLNGKALPRQAVMPSQQALLKDLRFAKPPSAHTQFPMTQGKDQLQELILRGEFR